MMSKRQFNMMWENARKDLSKSNDESTYKISDKLDNTVNNFMDSLNYFEEDRKQRLEANKRIEDLFKRLH